MAESFITYSSWDDPERRERMVKSLAKAKKIRKNADKNTSMKGNSRSNEIEGPEVQNQRVISDPTYCPRIPIGKSDPVGKEDLMGIYPSQERKEKGNNRKKQKRQNLW